MPAGRIAIALGGEPISDGELRQRYELGRNGIATVSLVMNGSGEVSSPPLVTTRGVPGLDEDEGARRAVAREVAIVLKHRRRYDEDVEELVRRAARREIVERSGVRPVVEVHVHRL